LSRLAADYPSHRRIMTEALSVVHVLVSGKPTEDGLPQHADNGMPAILASAVVGQDLAAIVDNPSASSSSRYANSPASEVTTEPRNCSIKRRSKSSLKAPSFDSPAGFVMTPASKSA
jgi:hypothetical protein